jgi:hypothetical protein
MFKKLLHSNNETVEGTTNMHNPIIYVSCQQDGVGGVEGTYIIGLLHLGSVATRFHKVRKLKFPPASKMFHSDSLVTPHLVPHRLF